MAILLSELYGKQIISNTGKKIGFVEDIVLNFENGSVSSLLLTKIDDLTRSQNTARMLANNSVLYERVKSVSETIIVGTEIQEVAASFSTAVTINQSVDTSLARLDLFLTSIL